MGVWRGQGRGLGGDVELGGDMGGVGVWGVILGSRGDLGVWGGMGGGMWGGRPTDLGSGSLMGSDLGSVGSVGFPPYRTWVWVFMGSGLGSMGSMEFLPYRMWVWGHLRGQNWDLWGFRPIGRGSGSLMGSDLGSVGPMGFHLTGCGCGALMGPALGSMGFPPYRRWLWGTYGVRTGIYGICGVSAL